MGVSHLMTYPVLRRLILPLLFVFVAPITRAAEAPKVDLARMEQVVQSHAKDFMGSVLVARGNDVLLSKSYGSANLEWAIPNSPSTKFRLGSVTKQFTAACILMLQERGKLKITDPVKTYMPDAPAAWDKVTIFHLLTHTSGIPSFTGFPDYETTEGLPTTPEKLVDRFRDKPLEFAPGEKWNYSNSGYVLLGYLLEKISGQSYAGFVQQNIFTPLGMKDSGYDSNSAIILHRASGYVPGPNGPANAGFIHMTIPFSAGALYSTTEDLLRWEQGLFGGKVLSAASFQAMTTPFKENYAFGVAVEKVGSHTRISHGGGIEGFNTHVAYFQDDRLTVIVLANLNGSAADDITTKLAAVAHGESVVLPADRKEVALPPAVLGRYPGTYEIAPGFSLVVTLEGNQLMAQATGQPKFPLFAQSESSFFLKVVDAQVDFVADDKGTVTHLILHQGGRDMKAPRR
jgi:CubicO group peptidase (beta-lactamase class C family)